jgi:hypothetical protein
MDDELFIMLNEDTIFRDRSRRNEVRSLDETKVLLNGWVGDNSNIKPTHNKDDVEALDKCAPLARFISFKPLTILDLSFFLIPWNHCLLEASSKKTL